MKEQKDKCKVRERRRDRGESRPLHVLPPHKPIQPATKTRQASFAFISLCNITLNRKHLWDTDGLRRSLARAGLDPSKDILFPLALSWPLIETRACLPQGCEKRAGRGGQLMLLELLVFGSEWKAEDLDVGFYLHPPHASKWVRGDVMPCSLQGRRGCQRQSGGCCCCW